MEEIIKLVSPANKEWVSQLKLENIAQILDSLSLVPHMKLKEFKSELPANVGKDGEITFENIINQYMPSDYKLEDTSKQGYKGDFILYWSSHKTNEKYKILIDVKNYKTTIPQKEVDKFYRDIQLNSDIHGGILLSLNSKIVGVSKIIEFKDVSTDNGLTPTIFTKSNKPEVICEVIKLLFHTIEIKSLNSNEIVYKNELIANINDLSDRIQLITSCRSNLQNTKNIIDKNINDIMFNLMQCEYTLATKIKQINKTLSEKSHIVVPELKLETQEEQKDKDFKYMISAFKNSLELNYEKLLLSIYNLDWSDIVTDIPKKHWLLYKSEVLFMYIKFNKKNVTAIFPVHNSTTLEKIYKNEKTYNFPCYKLKDDGYHIPIIPDNISLILELCS